MTSLAWTLPPCRHRAPLTAELYDVWRFTSNVKRVTHQTYTLSQSLLLPLCCLPGRLLNLIKSKQTFAAVCSQRRRRQSRCTDHNSYKECRGVKWDNERVTCNEYQTFKHTTCNVMIMSHQQLQIIRDFLSKQFPLIVCLPVKAKNY